MSKKSVEVKPIRVKTLGGYSVHFNDKDLTQGKQGESQIGMLLLLLLHYREEGVTRELVKNTLFEDRDVTDVSHSIRNILYNMKKRMFAEADIDGDLVSKDKGTYFWTDKIPVEEDAKKFEKAAAKAEEMEDGPDKTDKLMRACRMYTGRFMAGMDNVVWIFKEQERYRDIFKSCASHAAVGLRREQRYLDMQELGQWATKVDPFDGWEAVTLEALMGLKRYAEAEKVYESSLDAYIKEYGGFSNDHVKEVAKALGQHMSYQYETIEEITERLKTHDDDSGSYVCSLPAFRELYRTVERVMERFGETVYLMLCTLTDSKGNPIRDTEREKDLSAELLEAIKMSVRHTDTITKYGKGQYLILLMNTDKEGCQVVEKRIRSNLKKIRGKRTNVEYSVNSVIYVKEFNKGK